MDKKETLKQWLLKHKLDNYGYDYKWFNKMSGHKTRLNAKIRGMSDAEIRRNLAKAGILGKSGRLGQAPVYKKQGDKWVKTSGKQWDYTTGQSFNEELINMLQIGAGKKKSFWQTQDDWNLQIERANNW